MTDQEERLRDVLLACRVRHRVHEVFQLGKRFAIVDFFLFEQDSVIECWMSESRNGAAMGWMERNAVYIDLKFKRLKEHNPGMRCLAFAQAPQVDLSELVEVTEAALLHADYVAYTIDDFRNEVCQLGGAS